MKLAIVIATYRRPDGRTPELLTRALNSIKEQTYPNYNVFLVGDRYDNGDEFIDLATSIIDHDRMHFVNLPYAAERSKYALGSNELWYSGGVNARNCGISLALEMGFSYVCHLDHDDYWHPQHLEIINHGIGLTGAAFLHTCSTYLNSHLPRVELTNEILPSQLRGGNLIHSSVCIDHNKIPLRYRDVFEQTGVGCPADADLWDRMREYCTLNSLSTYLISTLTCFHPHERT